MPYTATQLITRAWNLSGIVARNLETVNGSQTTDGLFLLNALLDFKAVDVRLIPYFKLYPFNMVIGQESYFIPGLFQIQTLTFSISAVRYPMTENNRENYFGSGRVQNIKSLPYQWYAERELDGTRIYVYYLPQDNYPAQLTGKFGLTNVALNQDLLLVYDAFYIEYLRYGLAQMMCEEYDVEFAPSKVMMLRQYEKKLLDVSPFDLTMKKVSFMGNHYSLNYAQANIGMGWVP